MMRRLANILVVLAAIIVLYAMRQTKPHYDDLIGPIPAYGKMHETVHAREFDVTLDGVTFAHELTFTHYGETKVLNTSGLWAIVTAQLAATTDSTVISTFIWQGPTGLRYDLTRRGGLIPGQPPHALDPGIPKTVRLVFEIKPDQVNGATLLVSGKMQPALDSEARIALDDFKKFNDGEPLTVDSVDLLRPLPASGS
ncbi:MAG: hypothetical protein ACRECY_01400 [Phyllobacterium sp.]